MDVHHQMADGASVAELDLSVPAAHARETIDTIDDDLVSAASYALDGDGIVPEASDETISLFGRGRSARDGCYCGEQDKQSKQSSVQNHGGSFDSELGKQTRGVFPSRSEFTEGLHCGTGEAERLMTEDCFD
jgi:hypothetical protein